MTMFQSWYVLYVRGGAEEKARDALQDEGYEIFLPMHLKVTKPRHVRGKNAPKRKQVLRPMFSTYLFANLSLEQLSKVTSEKEVYGVLKVNDQPAVIWPSVIEEIRHVCEMGVHDEARSIQLFAGDQVILSSGPAEGYVGHVVRQPGSESRVDVEINGLKVVATLDNLRKLADQHGNGQPRDPSASDKDERRRGPGGGRKPNTRHSENASKIQLKQKTYAR